VPTTPFSFAEILRNLDPTPFAPEKAIWLEDRLPWVVVDESIPSFQKTLKAT
jgi:hypothetical protein